MNLCLNTDCLGHLELESALDAVAALGIASVEIATGGHSSAPHMRIAELLGDPAARARFAGAISSRGLVLNAINCSADPLHPRHGEQHRRLIADTIRLAGELGVEKIVSMSGCPGDAPDAPTINWIWFPWPDDMQRIREAQWESALAVWSELTALASAHGVERIALELLPLQLVYNVPTLQRLRNALGPAIGANIDPSHMFWQQMDPVRVVHALGPAVHHVHLKDTELYQGELALNGVLDWRPWDDPSKRAWVFRTIGEGHPASFWRAFFEALRDVGYDDALSIENEDVLLPGELGVRAAIEFATPLLEVVGGARRQPV
jgi:sugar phosphate isomerase/epimerase